MANFRFALQRVLDRRHSQEDEKRRAVSELEKRRRALEESLRTRQQEIAGGRDAWRKELVGVIDPSSLRHHATAGVGLFRKAQRTVLEMASLQPLMAKANAELIEAARARRTLEILREQRLAAFNALLAKREREQLDEFAGDLHRRASDEAVEATQREQTSAERLTRRTTEPTWSAA